MKTEFKKYHSSYYDTVCEFLIELSTDDKRYINWNWARWEWMVYHPEFDNNLADKIGLWFCSKSSGLVGMTTYDHYFGEAFYAVKKGYEEIEKEMVDYAIQNFSDENGLGIVANDLDHHRIDLLRSKGFVENPNAENILEIKFEANSFDYSLPKGLIVKSLNTETDLYKRHKVLWEGFENEGNMPTDQKTIEEQKRMLDAPHLNSKLHVVAENDDGEYVAYCGCWYNPKTDYAYVEPVCTIPSYRKKGIAKALLLEALKRCHTLGAKKAYVLSDEAFYKSIGFMQHSHHSFYWHK